MANWPRSKSGFKYRFHSFSYFFHTSLQTPQPNIAAPTCDLFILKPLLSSFPYVQTKLKKVKKWRTAWGSKSYIGCDKWWNQCLKPDLEPLPLYHFFTDFSLAHSYKNDMRSCLRISISHLGSAIFGCDLCENM